MGGMMDYEPITKELRLYAGMMLSEYSPILFHIKELCDAIDAIHASLEQENERLRNASECGDDWIKLPVDAEAPSKQLADWIEKRGLVTGPLDANGELWHIGDMSDSNWGVIEGICFDNGVWFISGHDISAPWIPADSIAHHRPDTWERIIEDAIDSVDGGPTIAALVARCKALCERTREGEE